MGNLIGTAFYEYVIRGGVMMIALVPMAVLAVAFIIQTALNLRRARVAPAGFIRELVAARGTDRARELIQSADHSLGDVIRNVVAHLEFHPEADPAEVLREEIGAECDLLHEQNSQLGVIYRIAPQCGLLGTVFGMISTFNAFARSASPDVQELSNGINEALITTAWGLAIAIPAYLAHYMVQKRIAAYEQVTLPREGGVALHALLDRPVSASSTAELTRMTSRSA